MTGMGVILGTAAYMSPEQARGRGRGQARRHLGLRRVLYEMLTGKRAFEGDDITETIGRGREDDAELDWRAACRHPAPRRHPDPALPREGSPQAHRRHRRRTIPAVGRRDARCRPDRSHACRASAAPRWRRTLPWASPRLLAGGDRWLLPRRPAGEVDLDAFADEPAAGGQARRLGRVCTACTAIALSPDGRLGGVRRHARHGPRNSYGRGLDHAEAKPVPGTEGATAGSFSPDGAWIGFRRRQQDQEGAGRRRAARHSISRRAGSVDWGASWGDDGTIFFAGQAGISRVSSAGGTPSHGHHTRCRQGRASSAPAIACPVESDTVHASANPSNGTANVVLQSLDNGEQRVLIPGGADARYVSTGHLVA